MRRSLLSAVLAAGLGTAPVWAQTGRSDRPEPPRGEPRPPENRLEVRPNPDMPQRYTLNLKVEMVKAAYLGVATSPAPKSLRHQVELPNGVGLVVDTVAPDSPAAAAGLKANDLLHKVDDQILINSLQLAVLVRTYKPGDSVKLTVLRGGKPVELTAKLIEKELPPLDELRVNLEPQLFHAQNWVTVQPPPAQPWATLVQPLERPPAPGMLMDQSYTLTWDDGTVQMTITAVEGKQTLVAKDKDGKELCRGPIDTAEQRAKLPPEVRDRLGKVWVAPQDGPRHEDHQGPGAPGRPDDRRPENGKEPPPSPKDGRTPPM